MNKNTITGVAVLVTLYLGTPALTAAPQTGRLRTRCLIDPSVPDDNAMAQVKRLTPHQLFPEAEIATHGPPANYSAPYPLSEYFFLCV